jgi:hypothetical protein
MSYTTSQALLRETITIWYDLKNKWAEEWRILFVFFLWLMAIAD